MFVVNYKVTSPGVLEQFIENLDYQDKVLVSVERMAICKADIRYFLGNRDRYLLDHKYPLTPIHEAVGVVVKDSTGNFKPGDKVILIPNSIDSTLCPTCPHQRCFNEDMGNNYCPFATFRSSNADGFLRNFYACEPSLLVKYSPDVDPSVAVYSELLSVANAACRRIDFSKAKKIAIFGDGIMAYVVYLAIRHIYKKDLTIFGIDSSKLQMFKDAKTLSINNYDDHPFDTLIECVGGKFSETAINQMIDIAQVGADLILMGVSEGGANINTRKVLEKGLSIKGITRSTRQDFERIGRALDNKDLQEAIKPMVISLTTIKSIHDIYHCYEEDIANTKIIGKNIMKF